MSTDVESCSSLTFAMLVRNLCVEARSRGLTEPVAFRSPPREPGQTRTLRRGERGSVIAVTIRDRTREQVAVDLVAGLLAANRVTDPIHYSLHTTALLEALNPPETP